MNGKKVTLSPPASDVGARTDSPARQYWTTAGHLSARAPTALLVMSAMPSDGALARTSPRSLAPVSATSTVGFAAENAFTPAPRISRVRSLSPTVSGETATSPAPGAVTLPVTSSCETVASAATSALSVTRLPMRMSRAAPSAVSAWFTAATGLSSRLGFSSTALSPIARPTCVTVPVARSSAKVSSPNSCTKLPSCLRSHRFPLRRSSRAASSTPRSRTP